MSKIVEKDVEARIITALRKAIGSSVDPSNVRFDSTWNVATDGEVKGVESPGDSVIVGVAASSPFFANWTTPNAEINCALSFAVRREVAPTGDALADVVGPVVQLLTAWQVRTNDDVRTALSTEGFDVQGFRIAANAAPPRYSAESACWFYSVSFALQGIVKEVK